MSDSLRPHELQHTRPPCRRRQWHPTPVLLPGKSHGQRSLWAAVHGVAKSRTRLSNFTFTFHFHALEKEMATHSSVLAWRIPGMGKPSGLLSIGSHRVGHDWSDSSSRPPCPSPTPRVYPNSCPLSRWCHPAISSSVVPFSSCPQSLPASESFPMSHLFSWGGQSIGVSA